MQYLLLLLLAAAFTECVPGKSTKDAPVVDLAKLDGWVIVVPADSLPSERYAAEEFQRFYTEAAGRKLDIVATADPEASGCILIGQPAAAMAHTCRFKPAKYGPEDLRIIVNPREIVIAGGRPRGTLYGVYTYLEDYLGIRFLTAEHTHVPPLKQPCPLPAIDRYYAPPIPWRYTYYGENHDHHEFAVRLRQNAIAPEDQFGDVSTQRLVNHSVSGLLPWSKYGATHPEYFCLRDGKRPTQLLIQQTYEIQPCFSHPEARRIMLENLRAQIKREYPKWKDYSVSQDDNGRFCTCPDCAAKDEAAGCHTGQLLDFVNWIAGEIYNDYPDITIGTLIYQWTRTPPKNMKPARNVKLQLCSIECCQIHAIDDPTCPLNKRFQEDLAGWAKLTDNIAIWNYNVNFANYLVPCPNLFNLERNVRYFHANHARGLFMQAAGNTTGAEFSELRNYIICRLIWDPSRSGTALMEEFLRLHYGPAAPPIRRFIDRVHAAAQQSGKHRDCFGLASSYGLSADLGRVGIADFAEAMTLAPDDATRARVEKASLAAWRMAIEPVITAPMEGRMLDANQKAEFRPLVEKFVTLCRKYNIKLVAEKTRLEDAAKVLAALVEDARVSAAQEQPTALFAAALQKWLALVQNPGQPVQMVAEVNIKRPGKAREIARLQFTRLARDAFHIEAAYGGKAFAIQRAPAVCFVHFPQQQTLYMATGKLIAGSESFSLAVIEQTAVRAKPEAATYIQSIVQILKVIDGPAAAAMLAAVGYAPSPGAKKDGAQEFAIRLAGGRLVFSVDLTARECRQISFHSPRLTVTGRLSFSVPTALPSVPANVQNTLTLPRGELESAMRETAALLMQTAIKGGSAATADPTKTDATSGKLTKTLVDLLQSVAKPETKPGEIKGAK